MLAGADAAGGDDDDDGGGGDSDDDSECAGNARLSPC
jgi:hypothetical protein